MSHAIRLALSAFRSGVRGNAAIEFALIVPILLVLLMGASDVGRQIHARLLLQSAVNAGLLHATWTEGKDASATTAVIRHQLGEMDAAITTETLCGCASSKGCVSACPTGSDRYLRVRVVFSGSVTTFLPDIELVSGFRIYTGKVS